MQLRELIADYLEQNDLSYRTFAKKCDISNSYLSMIKNDVNPSTGKPPVVRIEMLNRIAKGMGMSLHQLCEVVDDMPVDISVAPPKAQAQSDILYISMPGDNKQVDELRKYLHEVIDQLDDTTLLAMKNLTLKMNLKG